MESFDESLSIYFRPKAGAFDHIFCGYNTEVPKPWFQVIDYYAPGGRTEVYNLDSKKEMIEKFMELVKERL